jgi:hypothetical protein
LLIFNIKGATLAALARFSSYESIKVKKEQAKISRRSEGGQGRRSVVERYDGVDSVAGGREVMALVVIRSPMYKALRDNEIVSWSSKK